MLSPHLRRIVLPFTLLSSSPFLFAQATSVIANLPGQQPSGAPSGTILSGTTSSTSSPIQQVRIAPQSTQTPLRMSNNPSYGNNPSFNPSSVESGGIIYYGPHGSGSVLVDKTIHYGDSVSDALMKQYGGSTTSVGNAIAEACATLSPQVQQPGDCINIQVPQMQGNWRDNWTGQIGMAEGPTSTDSVVVFYPESFSRIHCATATYNTNTVGNDPDLPPPPPLDPNPIKATEQDAVAAETDPDHNTLMSFAGYIICYHNRPCPYQPGLQKKAPSANLSPAHPGLIGQQGSPSMVQFCTPPDKPEPIGLPNQQ